MVKKLYKQTDYDDKVTAIVNGYKDINDYYSNASCALKLSQIRVPTLLLLDYGDPIIGPNVIDQELYTQNPNILLGLT